MQVVLTAAHCLEDGAGWWTPDTVRLGWTDLRKRPPGGEEIQVKRIVVHPTYKKARKKSDLALLILGSPSRQTPATLPRSGLLRRLREGTWLWTGGFR